MISIKHSHSVFTFGVFRFMYSHSGIQDWVYRLAGKCKALTFSIHIQGSHVHAFTFRHSGLGIQAWVYRLADIKYSMPKSVHPNLNCEPEYLNVNTECEYFILIS